MKFKQKERRNILSQETAHSSTEQSHILSLLETHQQPPFFHRSDRTSKNQNLFGFDVSVRLSVRLSVTEMHWRIISNLCFKFRSKFTAHCRRREG